MTIPGSIDPSAASPLDPSLTNKKTPSPLSNTKPFSDELALLMKKGMKKKETPHLDKQKLDLSKNMLDNLQTFAQLDITPNQEELKTASDILGVPQEELSNLMKQVKNSLMEDIKTSLDNLGDILQEPNEVLSQDLKKKFQNSIQAMKEAFEVGFGVRYDEVTPKNIMASEKLIQRLMDSKDQFPKSFVRKLDLLFG